MGQAWVYEVTAIYPPDSTPRYFLGEILEKTARSVVVKYELTKRHLGPQQIKDEKGAWTVILETGGITTVKEECFDLSSDTVSLWGSKILDPKAGPVKNFPNSVVLLRRGMEAGGSLDL